MPPGEFRIEPVRRYRRATYPAGWVPPAPRHRRGRAAAFALALPIAAGGNWWACSFRTDGVPGITGPPEPGRLTPEESLAVVDRVIADSDFSRPDSCPTVPERLQADATFVWHPPADSTVGPVAMGVDRLAPRETIEPFEGCAGGDFPAVGFQVVPHSPSPQPSESLDLARELHQAAIGYFGTPSYRADEEPDAGYATPPDFDTREEAEAALETEVRAFIEGLRGEGFL